MIATLRSLIPQAQRTLEDCIRTLDKAICREVIKSLEAGVMPSASIRQSHSALVGRIQTQDRYGQ